MKKLLWHIGGWLFFILYEISVFLIKGISGSPLLNFIGFYTLNILLFYGYFLYQKKIQEKNLFLFKLFIGGVIAIIVYDLAIWALNELIDSVSLAKKSKEDVLRTTALTTARGIYFLFFSVAVWKIYFAYIKQEEVQQLKEVSILLENEKLQLQTTKSKLEKDLAVSEIKYLKAQINPHFIFNTLNYLYNGIEDFDEDRANALLLLSDILRYNLTDISPYGRVALLDEIDNIINLIKLAKYRFYGNCYIDYFIEGETSGKTIIPMILGTLTENIFKHGDISDPGLPAQIIINIKTGILSFKTANKTNNNSLRDDRPHTGLKFVQNRLAYFYNDKFSLTFQQKNNIFETELKIFEI